MLCLCKKKDYFSCVVLLLSLLTTRQMNNLPRVILKHLFCGKILSVWRSHNSIVADLYLVVGIKVWRVRGVFVQTKTLGNSQFTPHRWDRFFSLSQCLLSLHTIFVTKKKRFIFIVSFFWSHGFGVCV